ncbi:MAG: hypothetical protein SGILL_005599, partial [Bacillariaceae sp.]
EKEIDGVQGGSNIAANRGDALVPNSWKTRWQRFVLPSPKMNELMPDPPELKSWLEVCEEDGFVNRISNKHAGRGRYKFLHDRIQEASLALLSTQKLNNRQGQIGSILATAVLDGSKLDGEGSLLPSTSDFMVFTAANLLNAQETDKRSDMNYHQLMRLNHAAGIRAMATASVGLASKYFERAIDLMENDWSNNRALCAKIYEGAVLAEFSEGNIEGMDKYANALISREDVSLLRKVAVYQTKSQSLQSRDSGEEAMASNLDLLAKLGSQ